MHIWSRKRVCAGLLSVALAWGQAAQAGCGEAVGACEIAEGRYHLVLPPAAPDTGAGLPALMFLHGWGASGQATLGMRDVVETALARGYAVLAPDGMPRVGGNGRSRGFHPERPGPRDEIAFLTAVRDDAAAKHGIDTRRTILAGFSVGGSMASYLACAAPASFAAYAPVAGAFWVPLPSGCAGPVDLFHTHGWSDGVVPLEGRLLREASAADGVPILAQGDVWDAMQIWRAANGCRPNASGHAATGIFWLRWWEDCDSGRRLDVALFPGGHVVPDGWAGTMLDWFEGV